MLRAGLWATIALAPIAFSSTSFATAPTAHAAPSESFSFCVLGHLRGDKNGEALQNLDEVLGEVARLKPELVFLCGDLVWGDIDGAPTDIAAVERDWDALDAKLGALHVPIYRTAGNHDVNDVATRELWVKRYGELPRVVDYKGSRFVLVKSVWWPEAGSTDKHPQKYIRGKDVDDAQASELARDLADPAQYEHAFVFTHALLWWDADASWWRKVHPLLSKSKVSAVFGGDYGPVKFSYESRDGVNYYQSAIENKISLEMLRTRELSRILSAQFDNFLYVTVDGAEVRVEVRVVGATSTGKFSPAHFDEVNEYDKGSVARKLYTKLGTPEKLERGLAGAAVAGFVAGALAVGALIALLRSRARG